MTQAEHLREQGQEMRNWHSKRTHPSPFLVRSQLTSSLPHFILQVLTSENPEGPSYWDWKSRQINQHWSIAIQMITKRNCRWTKTLTPKRFTWNKEETKPSGTKESIKNERQVTVEPRMLYTTNFRVEKYQMPIPELNKNFLIAYQLLHMRATFRMSFMCTKLLKGWYLYYIK